MAERSFAATVSEFCEKEKGAAQATLRLAAQKVFNQMTTTYHEPGGRLPIKDGNLRNSIVASDVAMPTVKAEQETFTDVSGTSLEILGSIELGEIAYIGVQAAYGARMEFGFVGTDSLGRLYNQTGFGFLAAEEQKWQQTVTEAENEVRSRFQNGPSKA